MTPPIVDTESTAPGALPSATSQTDDVDGWRLLAQTLAGIVALIVSVALLNRYFGDALRSTGVYFVHRFGLAGFFFGTFIADAFHVPVPVQFYLLALVSSGRPIAVPLAVISVSSILAGHVGYRIGARLQHLGLFRRLLIRSSGRVQHLFARYGVWAVAVGAMTPIPYPVLCYLSGLYRIPYRLFSVLTLLRIPRLLAFYLFIRAGYGH